MIFELYSDAYFSRYGKIYPYLNSKEIFQFVYSVYISSNADMKTDTTYKI